MEKHKFTIEITYFKDSGKFYTSEEYEGEFQATPHGNCYMDDVVQWINALKATNAPMPGLSTCWKSGPIMVDCKEGYPCLILPATTSVSV